MFVSRIPVSIALAWLITVSLSFAQSDPSKPFPQNRVRDFYFHQAEQFLDRPRNDPAQLVDVLPQFPGLDGGGFGHWGQNPEEVSFDYSLNDVKTGNVVSQITHHFGRKTAKAVNVDLAGPQKTSVLFDPAALSFTDAWRGGFVHWDHVRFGLMGGVRPVGEQWLNLAESGWAVPDGTVQSYKGLHRYGADAIFDYRIGEASVLDACQSADGTLVRRLRVDGTLTAGTSLTLLTVADGATAEVVDPGRVITVQTDDRTLWIALQREPQTPMLALRGRRVVAEFAPDKGTQQLAISFVDVATDAAPTRPPAVAQLPERSRLVPQRGPLPDQIVTTSFVAGSSNGPVAIDTFTLPHGAANPFGSAMRLGGVAGLNDGRIAVSTLMGEVWTVRVPDQLVDGAELTWQRMAAGLYQPLGLVAENDTLLVLGSDQITRLHDFNDDGEADFYECVTNDFPTTGGHDFCTSLQQDQSGRLYWSISSGDFGVARRDHDGAIESLGNGLRNCNGIGVSHDGSVVLASVQEGTWTPASALFEVGDHSYHGLKGPRDGVGRYGYDLPLCFIPRGIDNSTGEVRFLPDDPRLGPLSGLAVGTSFGTCTAYAVLRDVVNNQPQGAIVPLPGDFLSGICRAAFREQDGCLYFAGTEGWQSYAAEDGCLQRMRLTGKPWTLPSAVEAHGNGVIVRFTDELDPLSVSLAGTFCQQWNYLYSAAYGSPEFSVKEPGRQGHDVVEVKSVRLLDDRRSVFIEIPQLQPVMQMHVHLRLRTAAGTAFTPDLYATIHELRADFTDYPEYAPVAKRRPMGYPIAEKFAQDPRLVEQESLGTNFGWVSSSRKLTVSATAGLQFDPRVLRVAPGERVSLAFKNGDPSMPHNVAVVRADRIDEFGEQSMLLASNPRAIATHYVPDDPAEICFSPILPPGDQYTMYFDAPPEPGEYRLVCTYPGHWRVMQGSLFVIAADAPLPESAFAPMRKFVRMWTTAELADDADKLARRNFEQGKSAFDAAGCIKCHRIRDTGVALGPELTKVSERFTGHKLLQQMLEPSTEINKQYQTWSAVMTDGRILTGLKTAEDAESLTLLPNPLKPADTITVPRAEIEELEASSASTMPGSLLITFSRDEILDLLAFVQSGGDPTHSVFAR